MFNIGHLKANSDWRSPAHYHPFHEIVVIFGGRILVKMDGKPLTGQTGDILFYPKGVRHEELSTWHDPVDIYYVNFEDEDTNTCPDIPLHTHDLSGRIRMLTSWLYADRNLFNNLERPTSPIFLMAILAELQCIQDGVEIQLLAEVRRYITAHMEQPLTLGDLASHAGMSKYHFLRTYKELSGHTPMQELTAIRIDHARRLILTTNLRLKQIARMSGLGDENQLSRLFRKHLNVPPSQFRKTVRADS